MGPPDATIICSIVTAVDDTNSDRYRGEFSSESCAFVFEKLRELCSASCIRATKLEAGALHIVLTSGAEALAALSMNELPLPDDSGARLIVELKSADWAKRYCERLSTLFQSEADADREAAMGGAYDDQRSASTQDAWAAVNINFEGRL